MSENQSRSKLKKFYNTLEDQPIDPSMPIRLMQANVLGCAVNHVRYTYESSGIRRTCANRIGMVYTIPPYLTSLAPGLGRQLGGTLVCTLPSIHVQHKDNSPDDKGLAIMQELVEKRYSNWQEVFGSKQLERLAQASGGDLRDFFRLLRDALVKAVGVKAGGIPVQDGVIDQTINQLCREMLPIAQEDKQWLRKITGNKKANLEAIDKLPSLARFFDTKLVLNYRNGDDWYDVHPLLKDEIKE